MMLFVDFYAPADACGYGSRLKAGTTAWDYRKHAFAFPRRDSPESCKYLPPQRGRREDRVRAAPAVSCAKMHKRKRTRAYRFSGGNPAFPARWFTAYSALSPVTGLSCHCRQRNRFRQLDASVGASGPHAFVVRIRAVRPRRIRVHRIPARVRDDRETPFSSGGTAALLHLIWVFGKSEYFCKRGWTTQITLIRFDKFDFACKRPSCHSGAMRQHRTRNLEIPGSTLSRRPGMTTRT